MPKTPQNWPASVLPRRLTREWAAYYCGMSPTTFDLRVSAGIYPKPDAGGRYDLKLLDAAIDRESGLTTAEDEHKDDWSFTRPPRRRRRNAA